MKTTSTKYILVLFLSFLFISSCTIQKRTVNKGYYVQWNWNKKISDHDNKTNDLADTKIEEEQDFDQISTVETSTIVLDEVNIPQEREKGESIEKWVQTKKIQDFKLTKKTVREVRNKVSKIKHSALKKSSKKIPGNMDWELILNIAMLVLFAVLSVVFLLLALEATGTMVFVWWGLTALCFVLFVTQVIDVIMY